MDTTRAARLASVPLLRALPPDRLEPIIDACRLRAWNADADLFAPIGDHILLLERGHAALEVTTPEGQRGILHIAGPGELIGEHALLQHRPAAHARVVGSAETIGIPAAPLRQALSRDAAVAEQVICLFADRAHRMAQVAGQLLTLDAAGRLAACLCDLAEQLGRLPDDGVELPLGFGHDLLAGLAGVSRETVSRALATFRRKGWIAPAGRTFHITDLRALQERAGTTALPQDRG